MKHRMPDAQILELREMGFNWKQIADRLDLDYRALRHWAINNNLTRKRTPGPRAPEPQETQEDLGLSDLIRLARANQRALDSVDPILTHKSIAIPGDAPAAIIFVSCMHLGSRFVQHEEFERLLEQVLRIPRLYWMALGDETEGFTGFFDVGSAHEQALADPKVQRRLLALVLDKLVSADKLLCGFASQHGSDWVRRKVAEDPIKRLYLERGIPYFDGQAYISLEVGRETYKIFAAHQLPGHSMYNKTHAQKRAALYKAPQADVIVQGDKHTEAIQRVSLDTWDYLAGERPSPYQWYVQVGTAKTGPDPYTIKTWSPGYWGWPILIFHNDRHQIVEAGDLEIARLLLQKWR